MMVGLGIGALFMWLTLRKIDFALAWTHIMQAQVQWILIASLIYVGGFIMRSMRWRILLDSLKQSTAYRLFSLLILGFFMNSVLPMRIGELIRAHVTGQKLEISRSSSLATIFVERLFDGLTYAVLFIITALMLPIVPPAAKKSIAAGGVVFGGLLIVLFFVARNRERAARAFERVPLPQRFEARIRSIFNNFLGGLGVFSTGSSLVKVFALSLAVWTIEGCVYMTMGFAFGLHMSIYQAFLVMIVIGTGAVLPAAPGFVGTVELLGVSALEFLGFETNRAFGYIITLHLMQLVMISILGMRSLIIEKLSFSDLVRIEKKQ